MDIVIVASLPSSHISILNPYDIWHMTHMSALTEAGFAASLHQDGLEELPQFFAGPHGDLVLLWRQLR